MVHGRGGKYTRTGVVGAVPLTAMPCFAALIWHFRTSLAAVISLRGFTLGPGVAGAASSNEVTEHGATESVRQPCASFLHSIAAGSQQDLLASRMVDVRPVRDVDHSDRVLFIVDLVPDTVMSAPSGPVALKWR